MLEKDVNLSQAICTVAVDLKAEFLNTGLKIAELLSLLITHNSQFELARGNDLVKELSGLVISKGKGFLSFVYLIVVRFDSERPDYKCILKVPLLNALGDTNSSVIIEAHNMECEFYTNFNWNTNIPIPKVYVARKVEPDSQTNPSALILMESFADCTQSLHFFESATPEQVMAVARVLANLQFHIRDSEKREWWVQKTNSLHFNDYYDKFILQYYPLMEQKYPDALTLCHGDLQPNNVLFKLKDGKMKDDLTALIDWQLCFCGSAMFDLTRFLILAVDMDIRNQIFTAAFECYYNELSRLYTEAGELTPFTYTEGLELYELAICHQACALPVLIAHLDEAYKELEINRSKLPTAAEECMMFLSQTVDLIKKYDLGRFEKFSVYK